MMEIIRNEYGVQFITGTIQEFADMTPVLDWKKDGTHQFMNFGTDATPVGEVHTLPDGSGLGVILDTFNEHGQGHNAIRYYDVERVPWVDVRINGLGEPQ